MRQALPSDNHANAATPDSYPDRRRLPIQIAALHVELLDHYVAVWRPIVGAAESRFLFPGKELDQPKGKGTLSAQIKELVYGHTRLQMPAHRFRHAAGKIYLDRHPGEYEVVRQLLGHKDIKTTISFYAGAETASAARHYAKTIFKICEPGISPESR